MSNSGTTMQPGAVAGGANPKANEVQSVGRAWRGEVLRTLVRLVPATGVEVEDLHGAEVTIAGRTMTFRGWALPFYLRPGDHAVSVALDGYELVEPEEVSAGGEHELTVDEEGGE